MSEPAILTTPRLRLRATREDDIPALHARVLGDPAVMRHAFGGAAMAHGEAEAFVRAQFNFSNEAIGLSTLVEAAGGEVIGFAGLNRCDVLGADDLEIGFVLARRAWGRGFASEIGAAQLALGFGRLKRARLLALAAPDNAASIRVLEKLGMAPVADVESPGRGARRVFRRNAG